MDLLTYKPHRIRLVYLAFFFLAFYIGQLTRWYPQSLPYFIAKYGGDFVSGWMAIGLWGAILPRLSIRNMAIAGIVLLFADELSQAYHAPWIDRIRGTFVGHMLLGEGFVWSDLACYFLGVVSGSMLEYIWYSRQRSHGTAVSGEPAP